MKKKVIVVGGGFGGLSAAKVLAQHSDLVDVYLVDKRNHHLFQPLLYQVATAGLSPSDIAIPIRAVFSEQRNVNVFLEEVTSVDFTTSTLKTKNTTFNYDYAVFACGSSHSYFGNEQWEKFAPGLKTLEMAIEIRRRILSAFEAAEKEFDPDMQKKWLTFVVVGAGPTGVEMAGAISEIARQTMIKDFRNLKIEDTRIFLVEGGQRVLASFHQDLSQEAKNDLESIGVTCLLSSKVTEINDDGVMIKTGDINEFINAKTVVWAAGVKANLLNKTMQVELDNAGRVIIDEHLNVKNFSNAYVIGDQAHFLEENGRVLPGLAPVAIQMGKHSANNIIAQIKGERQAKFKYLDKGQMATIGRSLAVMEYHNFRARGLFAWLSWLFVHIYYLIGFKNRFIVMFQWFWSYITFSRGSRLITKDNWMDS